MESNPLELNSKDNKDNKDYKMNNYEDMQKKIKKNNPEEFFLDLIIGKIRAYRIFYDVSQRELSRRSGVTQNIISRMENATHTPKLQTLIKLMNALELELEVDVKPRNKANTEG